MLAYPAIHIQQINILYTINFIVLPDDLKKGIPHLTYQVIPDNDKFFIQETVFDQHFKFEQNSLGSMQGIRKDQVEFIAFQFGPAISIPYIGG